ncbi:SusF/SusE family outer membrane protein [Kaistella sp.]|uniref:SusF/SusE family outer membrane protein n=1 Tax=Kaistella sp. TaxID=2782235 RepID=UPI003C64EFFF
MKNNHIFKAVFILLILIGLSSCTDREIIQVENSAAPIVMDLSAEHLFLDKNFPDNPALNVTWTQAAYTIPVEIAYKIEASATEDFKTPVLLGTVAQSIRTMTFTVKQINEACKSLALPIDVEGSMFIRVTSFLGVNQMSAVSNATSVKVTPYAASPTYDFQDLFLVGASTAAGWDNSATNSNLLPLLKTADPSKYTFTGYFKKDVTDAGFKIIKVKGSWDAQFGAGATAGTLSTDGGSGNLQVPADGYYKLSIDIDALTYTLETVTAPVTVYTNISIIGTVNGDDFVTDKQLTQSSFDPHLWSASAITLSEGEFKFRANNSWDTSWGGSSEYFGTATQGGANIPLASEWIYDVYFNDATGDYTLIPIK